MEIPHFLSISSLLPAKSCEYLSQAVFNQCSVSVLLCSVYFSPRKALAIVQVALPNKYVVSLQTVYAKMI